MQINENNRGILNESENKNNTREKELEEKWKTTLKKANATTKVEILYLNHKRTNNGHDYYHRITLEALREEEQPKCRHYAPKNYGIKSFITFKQFTLFALGNSKDVREKFRVIAINENMFFFFHLPLSISLFAYNMLITLICVCMSWGEGGRYAKKHAS